MIFRARHIAVVHLALFALVITGVVPRAIVPFWTFALLVWAAWVRPEDSVPFFIAAIPTFIAIPITADYDALNMWRPLAVIIFLRWFLSTQSFASLRGMARGYLRRPASYPVTTILIVLAALSAASVLVATDTVVALRRFIYLTNACLVPLVAYALAVADTSWRRRAVKAMAWSAVLVTAVAFIQLACTYLMDVYAFMRIWGEGIQLRQFGALWSQLAVRVGNTWLAYYGPQLSLRVFSLFPDSHSFPVYLLLALGGVLAFALRPITSRIASGTSSLRQLAGTRAQMTILWFVLGLLAVILSGTRGIWAASAGLPIVVVALAWWMRRTGVPTDRRLAWRYLGLWLAAYYLLFTIAWPIFVSPQFLISSGDRNLLTNRLRSIVDFGETSNRQRLEIWRASVRSIAHRPLLGVGIGNFPVVMGQNIILAKAGSSAHNVWLNVAAETGIPALLAFIALWVVIFRSAYRVFTAETDRTVAVYAGWMLLAIPWIAAYLLTDAALFDERALLLFAFTAAVLRATETTLRHG